MEDVTLFAGIHSLDMLDTLVPIKAALLTADDEQRAIPAIAKDAAITTAIDKTAQSLATRHYLVHGDARNLDNIPDASIHLVITSPPYWTLKKYPDHEAQLGDIKDYDTFLKSLDAVWKQVYRVLVPGGRLVVVVGDVLLPRRVYGRHVVFPLHASIQEHCRTLGFDNLAPIIWHKIGNARFEASRSTSFLGKPYEPNGIIKNDIEYILFQRKPGGYRQPTLAMRVLSVIPEAQHREYFQQIWTSITGASTRQHPAPFPLALAERLVRMFSFVGDTVLDPFMGTGTTNLAAGRWGRNSIGVEIEPKYHQMAATRLREAFTRQTVLSVA